MHLNAPESAYYELARAVAFANVSLDGAKVVGRWTSQDRHGQPRGTFVYEPFEREIARALRYPGAVVPERLRGRRVLRPLFGFKTGRELREAQQRIRHLLSAMIPGGSGPGESEDVAAMLIQEGRGLTLSMDIEVLSGGPWPRVASARGRRGWRRAFLQPIQVGVTYVPKAGYPSLLNAVILGGTAHLLNRLGRCQTCTRFILGRTDRPVRYCAEVECRSLGAPQSGEPRSAAARHKRAQRARLRDWHAQATRIDEASRQVELASDEHGRRRAANELADILTEARARLPECFRWASSKARAEAERLVSSADEKVATVRGPRVRK
jgi:hypothetical protein